MLDNRVAKLRQLLAQLFGQPLQLSFHPAFTECNSFRPQHFSRVNL
jgi:hypothetical protein